MRSKPAHTATSTRARLATPRSVPHSDSTAPLPYDAAGGVWVMTLTWLAMTPPTMSLSASAMPSNRMYSATLNTLDVSAPRSMPNGSDGPDGAEGLAASGIAAAPLGAAWPWVAVGPVGIEAPGVWA